MRQRLRWVDTRRLSDTVFDKLRPSSFSLANLDIVTLPSFPVLANA